MFSLFKELNRLNGCYGTVVVSVRGRCPGTHLRASSRSEGKRGDRERLMKWSGDGGGMVYGMVWERVCSSKRMLNKVGASSKIRLLCYHLRHV